MKIAWQVLLTGICLTASRIAVGAAVEVSPDCIGMGTVAWSQKTLSNGNAELTLRATAEEGYAFAEWSVADSNVVAWTEDLRYPGPLTVTVTSNATVTASFVAGPDDCLEFDIGDVFPEEIACGEMVSETLNVDSVSFPAITFEGLPPGLSYNERTLSIFGAPTVPGLYEIEARAVNGNGFEFRSFCTVRVANIDGARVSGSDDEIPVDEYYYAESSNLFAFAEEPRDISLKANVPGLTWNKDWQLLYGTPKETGVYVIKATVRFPTGAVETATMMLTVVGASPDDYGLDLTALDNLTVGDEVDETCEIGADTSDVKIKSVTGLPSGLKATSRLEYGVRRWYVSGTVREPGFFNVVVQVDDCSDETHRVVEMWQKITVADIPDVYLSVTSEDISRGTVLGGGAVSPVDDVTLVASAKSGYVFSGWYDEDIERLVLVDGVDYRTASITLPVGTDFLLLAPVAHFAPKSEDVAPDLSELEDADFYFAPDEMFAQAVNVDSLSLPELTFKGLPRGMSCTAIGDGSFVLMYDPTSAEAASGRYTVTVTAVNRSGAKAITKFRVTVGNRTDVRINVDDDYGELTPGEEMDAISLADAVDFARGETLTVSGLPRGLTYNAKANVKKSIEAHTITGTPTVPGEYTLTFKAKVISGETTNKSGKVSYSYATAMATSFLTVLPYPELVIEIDEDAATAGCKVTGAGNYKAGSNVSLKATAGKGWVFAGWEGLDDIEGLAALNPKLSYVTGGYDTWAQACFVPVSEDGLTVYVPELAESGFAAEWPLKEPLGEGDATLIADLIETASWPTVKVAGLPSGVKFSATTLLLSGKPTKSGVYHVTVSAKNVGGYSFVRVFDIAVLNADGSLPEEAPLANAAEIDFSALTNLVTGVYCPSGAVGFEVGAKPGSGSAVKKVVVSGLPAGLKASVKLVDEGAIINFIGTPAKPGRLVISASVTYVDGKTLKSQAAIVVEDGGSYYLQVSADDEDSGSVTGEGVYASGATVKLVAKPKSKQVFAGWWIPDGEGELSLFAPIRDIDGIDPRTASVTFPFRPADFNAGYELTGVFVPSTNDPAAVIELESEIWNIDSSETSSYAFSIDSHSVPKVTVKGLPKGVTVDAARGLMNYAPTAATVPGIYAATISAKNLTQKQASVRTFEVRVANWVSDVIGGLNPDMDAYPMSVGVTIDSSLIVPTVKEGWKLSVSGLPTGLSYKDGVVSGIPGRVGNYTVTFIATTGSGKNRREEKATIILRIGSLPTMLAGTFNGILTEVSGSAESIAGTINATMSTAGRISATVVTPLKRYSFAAKSWDALTNGIASAVLANRNGSRLCIEVDSTAGWQSWQLSGVVAIGEKDYECSAQRNSFGDKDGVPEAVAVISGMTGESELDMWKIKIAKSGVVTIAGKYAGKTISGEAVLQCETDAFGDGEAFFARYVTFPDAETAVSFVFYFDVDGIAKEWKVE